MVIAILTAVIVTGAPVSGVSAATTASPIVTPTPIVVAIATTSLIESAASTVTAVVSRDAESFRVQLFHRFFTEN